MSVALQIRTKVLPGHRIEITAPELVDGKTAMVYVVQDEEEIAKRPIYEILKDYPGQRLFKTAEEVDAYIREERESWE